MNAKFTFINRRNEGVNLDLDAQINNFIYAKRVKRLSEKTIKTYGQSLNAFAKWYVQQEQKTIDSELLRAYIHYLTYEKRRWDDHPTSPVGEKGLSNRTVNNTIRNLKVFFNFLVDEKIISAAPSMALDYQTEDKDTFEVFTDEDIINLLSAPNKRVYTGRRDYVMMLVLIDTGLRIGELTSLLCSDIDFKMSHIVIRAEIAKNKKTRVIPISRKTLKELQDLIEYMNIEEDDYIWLTQFGERYYADTFSKMLKKYGKRAGVADARVSPHTFRHYFAVKFLKLGGDPIALMRILGHTSLHMTERYVRYTQSDLSEQHKPASPVTNLIDKGNEKKRGKRMFL